MATTAFSATRIPNGTYGDVWIDGEKLCECYGAQGKVDISSDTINLCGVFMEQYKPVSAKGSGSLMLYKVDSGLLQKLKDIQRGIIPNFTIVTNLSDPASVGAERIAYYNVQFTDLTLADWKAATSGTITAPFTFGRYEYLDLMEVQ